jgi:hypothetical protein
MGSDPPFPTWFFIPKSLNPHRTSSIHGENEDNEQSTNTNKIILTHGEGKMEHGATHNKGYKEPNSSLMQNAQ